MINFKAKTFWILFVIGILSFGFSDVSAQAVPEFMATWKANSYVPPDYLGKVLPTGGTRIDMALELIDNGQLADLSQIEIRWLANNDIVSSGKGLKTFSFAADQFKGDQTVNITIPSYKGNSLAKKVIIPLAKPEAVITGGPSLFSALLYFFNISGLSQVQFTWSANGVETPGIGKTPDILNLNLENLPKGTEISVGVRAQNVFNALEMANKSIRFNL